MDKQKLCKQNTFHKNDWENILQTWESTRFPDIFGKNVDKHVNFREILHKNAHFLIIVAKRLVKLR